MKLSQQQFRRLLKEKQLVLSLIGMSNAGKTHWAKKLNAIGFEHISCDDLIEEKLTPVLEKGGYSGILGVARWMGQPQDKNFNARQKKYASIEKQVMENIFADIESSKDTAHNSVIDTTGSIVHLGGEICDKLKRHSLVVYIKDAEGGEEQRFQRYLQDPKPVIWGTLYSKRRDETATESLSRCYRELLAKRHTLYTKYADVIISRELLEGATDARQFISLIKESL